MVVRRIKQKIKKRQTNTEIITIGLEIRKILVSFPLSFTLSFSLFHHHTKFSFYHFFLFSIVQNSWIWAKWNSRGPLNFEWILIRFVLFPRLSFPRKNKIFGTGWAKNFFLQLMIDVRCFWMGSNFHRNHKIYTNSFLFNFSFSFWCCNVCCHIKRHFTYTYFLHIYGSQILLGWKMLKFSNKQYFSAFFCVARLLFRFYGEKL